MLLPPYVSPVLQDDSYKFSFLNPKDFLVSASLNLCVLRLWCLSRVTEDSGPKLPQHSSSRDIESTASRGQLIDD